MRTLTRARDAVAADAMRFTGLEEAEQHALHAEAHLAQLVEKHRPVVGNLEQPGLVADGAGETAALVTEQL